MNGKESQILITNVKAYEEVIRPLYNHIAELEGRAEKAEERYRDMRKSKEAEVQKVLADVFKAEAERDEARADHKDAISLGRGFATERDKLRVAMNMISSYLLAKRYEDAKGIAGAALREMP